MPKKYLLSRKDFLKTCTVGAGALCLTGMPAMRTSASHAGNPDSTGGGKGFTSPVEASWYEQEDGQKARCLLCPNECLLEQGERSLCRVRENRNGKLYTLAHSNPALIQQDPVERKPFFHVVPGSRALSVSTAGCNLRCKFCQVWDMALVRPEDIHAYHMPPDQVIEQAKAAGLRSMSYAFGEPVVFFEYMMEMAELAMEAGLLNLVHTAAYIKEKPLTYICQAMDAANVDLKGFNADFYRRYVGGELSNVLNTLLLMKKSGIHVEVTTIVIPGINDSPAEIAEMCKWIVRELGPDTPLHFARFYPLYRLSGLPRTPVSTLEMAREKAMEAGINYVYIAKVTGHEAESTFCPGCKARIITRLGFIVDRVEISNGQCDHCGHKIPGIWA
ncbi:AmmeMemoRadiSam system radical SAM enzyme [Desulfonatronovibrio magnus]|uniref:AmmeMemoRadiSam system radical SAM enzyme n=1 Tax=Desulfonatronovibrio magnus TaxID=698827 RepID=UPI0006960AB7|nr:AmmeMemoRadiSam system radical SAM enzyme [Desulfonatronovibrio magnus]